MTWTLSGIIQHATPGRSLQSNVEFQAQIQLKKTKESFSKASEKRAVIGGWVNKNQSQRGQVNHYSVDDVLHHKAPSELQDAKETARGMSS
jgi:hypothetical protein